MCKGTTYHWLFGLMDDKDRQEILNYLEVQQKNNHNIVKTVNQQISVNKNCNDNTILLKNAINKSLRI